jgi:hypothetical protein
MTVLNILLNIVKYMRSVRTSQELFGSFRIGNAVVTKMIIGSMK